MDNGRLQGHLGAPWVQLRLGGGRRGPARVPGTPWPGAAGRRRALTGGRGAHASSGGGQSSRSRGSRRARGAAPRSRAARAIRPGAAGPAGPLRAAAPYSLRPAPAPPPAPFVLNSPRRDRGRRDGGGGKGTAGRLGARGPGDPGLIRGGPSLVLGDPGPGVLLWASVSPRCGGESERRRGSLLLVPTPILGRRIPSWSPW